MTRGRRPRRGPATLSAWIAVCAAVVAWGGAVPFGPHASVVCSVGLLLVGVALLADDRPVLSVGASGLLVGALLAAGEGAPPATVLVGVTASVLAWDAGHNAIGVGRQLGRAATTARAELPHVLASGAAGGCIVAVALAVASVAGGAQPLIAVVFLLLAAGALALVLGPPEALEFELPE